MQVGYEVSANCTSDPQGAWSWFNEVEKKDSKFDDFGDPGKFPGLDAKLCAALMKRSIRREP